uniref:Uncharacterized protein n=1 Tax=Caenorhabditis japonica TaxID=281687 RepID=A0A8R1HHH2_CAEJA
MDGLPKVVQTNDEAVRNHQIQQRPAHVKAAVTEDLQAQLEMYRQQVAELQRINEALLSEQQDARDVRSLAWPAKKNQSVEGQSFSRRIGVPKLHQASAPHAVGLGGNEVRMAGAAFVTSSIGSQKLVHRVHFSNGECTPEGPRDYNIILGNDLLAQLPRFSIDYNKSIFHMGGENLPIGSRHNTCIPQKISSSDENNGGKFVTEGEAVANNDTDSGNGDRHEDVVRNHEPTETETSTDTTPVRSNPQRQRKPSAKFKT